MRYHQAILVSCEVPWDEKERLLEDVFRAEVRHVLALGFRDLYVFGTAGEGYAVDAARYRDVLALFREETRGDGVFPQVGAIGLSTAVILERLTLAYDAGFRMFQISLPSWGALNDSEVLRFFRDVCGTFPDARFLHYNLGRTKRVLAPADYRRIAGEVPNLAATKNTGLTIRETSELLRLAPEMQHFLSEYMYPAGCMQGECSMLSSLGPMMPAKTKELFEYGRTGQVEKLFRLHAEYVRVAEAVLAPMRRRPMMDGAYDKVLKRLGGVPMPLRLLSPYDCFSEEVYEECRRILDAHPGWAD
ncbi:MAG: dihydrodipicolinate synthase family protein [Acidobacteriales bacterium]|nr:dihydrodipicolinate synthase family protein [Terriglobales bacterium]